MRKRRLLLKILAAAGILSAQSARAGVLPTGAGYLIEIDGSVYGGPNNGVFQTAPQSGSGSIDAGTLDVNASASATAQPLVSASAASAGCTSNGCGGGTVRAEAKVDYFFVVSGPSGELVPIDVAIGGGGAVIGDYATGYVSVQVNGFDVWTSSSNGSNGAINPTTCSVQGCINTTVEFDAAPDLSYVIQMDAAAVAYDDVSDSSSVWADPYIYISPTFADASKYSVSVSSGVGNSPSNVPEPATIALFTIGLAGLAAFRRISRSGFRGLALLGGAVILGILVSPPKAAAGTVSVIEDVSGTPGDWTLDFSILNNLTTGFDVYYLAFRPTAATATYGLTGSPRGWAPVSGGGVSWCVLPSQCFSSVPNNGTEISGFQIQSSDVQYPVPLPYLVYAIDWTNSNPPDPGCIDCGFNPGYIGTTEIPELGSWSLFSGCVIVLVLASMHRSGHARFARMFLPTRVSYKE